MATKAGVPLLASVPLDPAIVEAGDSGKPYVYHYSKSVAAQEFSKAIGPILALEDTDKDTAPATSGSEAVPAEPDSVRRFAVPTSNGLLCPHFGHCEEFTLVDVGPDSDEPVSVTKIEAPEHEPGLLPSWLADRGVSLVIAGGMGSKAQQLFAQQGVTVVTGAPQADPENVVKLYLQDELVTGDNVCDH